MASLMNNELEIFNSDSSIFNLNFSTGISINTSELFFNPKEISDDEITMLFGTTDL